MNLTKYEQLLAKAKKENLTIYEKYDLTDTRLKGLYCDGSAALSKDLQTDAEKHCILSEELGHHLTTAGDILELQDEQNRKQELRARVWAYDYAIGIPGIIAAYHHGCRNPYEIADFLGVTEAFLLEAVCYYQSKYGLYATEGDYLVYFEPMGVLKLYE